jgi:hypothetical protein
MSLGVAGFAFGCVPEEAPDFRKALYIGQASEVQVPAIRLRLIGKGLLQIFVRSGSL